MNRIRILLADDNQSILQLLTDYFARKEDIEIVAAVTDGGGILEEIREKQPDIVVTDIIMPRCDGFTVLEEIQKMEPAIRPKF